MPKTEQQFKKIRDNRKEEIIDVALQLFATEGYHSTSIAKIAKKAEISKGLVYNYFKSKEELLIKVVENAAKDVYKYFDLDNNGVLETSELKSFIDGTFHMLKEKIHFWRLYLSFAFNPQILEVISRNIPQKSEKILEMMVDYFRRQGVSNPMTETMYFASVLKGIAVQYIVAPEQYPLEDMKKKLLDQFCYFNG
ncbi:MAG: TetR/AcrR family transcriptional regulator [Bacteroidales bacterium]|nr:TetR/AcrR family transcriptional regulator [Bacteroidales bacterium]MCF8328004.1 TetR/AcrR family transcriptional regulator [Bacteroidales bacterium]